MAEYNYFEELKQGLEDAVAFKDGDKRRARSVVSEIPVPKYQAADITRVRSKLNLSQRGFAAVLGVSARTVEAWEIGRNIPSGSTRHLLYLIENNGSLVDQLITKQ